jgi:hypothetical protein
MLLLWHAAAAYSMLQQHNAVGVLQLGYACVNMQCCVLEVFLQKCTVKDAAAVCVRLQQHYMRGCRLSVGIIFEGETL